MDRTHRGPHATVRLSSVIQSRSDAGCQGPVVLGFTSARRFYRSTFTSERGAHTLTQRCVRSACLLNIQGVLQFTFILRVWP
jgi:hypothetical protein